MIPIAKKNKPIDNFKMAVGMGVNWVDLNAGVIYQIQEYKEALDNPDIPKEKKPTKIRMTRLSDNKEMGWVDEYEVAQKMKDPKPDPRYAAETPEEHRKSF